MTLKAVYKGGSEAVFEVKNYGYSAPNDKISYHVADGDAGDIPISGDVVVVYAMNSAGSTIGKYYNHSIERAKAEQTSSPLIGAFLRL